MVSSRLLCPQHHKQQKRVRGWDSLRSNPQTGRDKSQKLPGRRSPEKPCLRPITSASPGKRVQDSPGWGTRGALLASIDTQLALGCQARRTLASKDRHLEAVWSSRFQGLQAWVPPWSHKATKPIGHLCHIQALQCLWGIRQMVADDEAVGGSRWAAAGAEGALDSLSCSNTWTLTAVCFKAGASRAVGTHSEQPKDCLEPKKQTRSQNCRWEVIPSGAKAAQGQIGPVMVLCVIRLPAQPL